MLLHRLAALSSLALGLAACSAATDSNSPAFSDQSTGGAAGAGAAAAMGTGSVPGSGSVSGSGSTTGGGAVPLVNNSSAGAPDLGNFVGMDPSTKTCAGIVNKGEQITVDIYIMFDQSLSMTCMVPNGTDRWDAVKAPLQQFVQDPMAAGINVGIGYFGPNILSSCNAADYQMPDVEIGPLPMNAMPIVNSLNAHMPVSNTPTAAALTGAINHAIDWKNQHPGHTVVVVLVTDGEPNACGAVADVANAAQMGFMATIPTYVIGITSNGTMCAIDPNPPNQMDLDTVAMAGGTMSALIVDVTQNPAQTFLATMNQIRAKSQVPCQYALPKAMPGMQLDPKKVNVELVPPGAAMGNTIPGVDIANACDPVMGGWYYDNPTTPTKINLCPATCQQATMLTGAEINISVGCATVHPA
jgi:hypothetical protein